MVSILLISIFEFNIMLFCYIIWLNMDLIQKQLLVGVGILYLTVLIMELHLTALYFVGERWHPVDG